MLAQDYLNPVGLVVIKVLYINYPNALCTVDVRAVVLYRKPAQRLQDYGAEDSCVGTGQWFTPTGF